MNVTDLLQPVVALLVLSAVMWFWMYATRIPAIQRSGMVVDSELPNGQQMAELPARVRWKADNYNHLMEQPTLFYAVIMVLAILGETNAINVGLAWAYVSMRLVHSLVQALANIIMLRFILFVLASLPLFGLIGRAVQVLW